MEIKETVKKVTVVKEIPVVDFVLNEREATAFFLMFGRMTRSSVIDSMGNGVKALSNNTRYSNLFNDFNGEKHFSALLKVYTDMADFFERKAMKLRHDETGNGD